MIRLIFIFILIVLVYFFIKRVLDNIQNPRGNCPTCDGQGYWYATRGEREYCRECDGSGFIR